MKRLNYINSPDDGPTGPHYRSVGIFFSNYNYPPVSHRRRHLIWAHVRKFLESDVSHESSGFQVSSESEDLEVVGVRLICYQELGFSSRFQFSSGSKLVHIQIR